MLAGLPLELLCSRPIASISQRGPVATPMRKPVIAWLLETPETVQIRSARSGASAARVACGWPV